MYEDEVIKDQVIPNRDHRLSSYFTFTLAPVPTVKFSNTTYIQPKFGDIRDYRLSNDNNMVFTINKYLKMITSFHFLYDARPPEGIPTTNYEVTNGLVFSFK